MMEEVYRAYIRLKNKQNLLQEENDRDWDIIKQFLDKIAIFISKNEK